MVLERNHVCWMLQIFSLFLSEEDVQLIAVFMNIYSVYDNDVPTHDRFIMPSSISLMAYHYTAH